MKLEVYALSNVGLKRTINQDNYFCNGVCADISDDSFRYRDTVDCAEPAFYAVFDGMGGHVHGERASQIAVEEADKAFRVYSRGEAATMMGAVCTSANNRICDEMIRVVKGRMGSTAVMALFEDDRYHLCNLGDSPAFLLRDGVIDMISCEHSERKNYEEIFGKNYSPDKKFKLTQHLGIFPDEMVIDPYFTSGELREGDILLLCSDGLTDMVPTREIQHILTEAADMKTAGEKLLSLALQNGGKDNITMILCKAVTAPRPAKSADASVGTSGTKTAAPKRASRTQEKKTGKKMTGLIALCALLAIAVIVLVIILISNNGADEEASPTTPDTEMVQTDAPAQTASPDEGDGVASIKNHTP